MMSRESSRGNPLLKQYTWVKFIDGRVHAARLDRFYITGDSSKRVGNVNIIPNIISDHKMITMDLSFRKKLKGVCIGILIISFYKTMFFCENFKLFWEI